MGSEWAMRGETARVRATGMTLDYVVRGDPWRPTVLLLMGLSGQRILWPTELADGLVAAGFRVVAYDHRDVGLSTILDDAPGDLDTLRAALSGWPFEPPYTLSDLALDALGLLDHLGVARAHVAGVSMGGMIAQHLAFDHPQRVASLTSINSTPGVALPVEPHAALVDYPDPTPPEDPETFVPWLVDGLRQLSSRHWFDPAATRELARAVAERGIHPRGTIRHLLAVLADGDRTARLGRIRVPTLVLHGADDPLIVAADGEATAAAIRGARLTVLEDMGHELPLPLVPRITAEIARHVAEAEPGGPTH